MLYRPGECVVYRVLRYVRDRRSCRRRYRYLVARAQREYCLAFRAFDGRITVGHLVLYLRMRTRIIRPLAVKRLDLQLCRARRYLELADCLSHLVVCGCYIAPRDLICVVARTDCRLAARDLDAHVTNQRREASRKH